MCAGGGGPPCCETAKLLLTFTGDTPSMRFAPLIFCAMLAGCGLAPVTPVVVPDFTTPTLSGRQAVRNFINVVKTVGPVAEATCRAQAPDLNCNFLIVIDDTEGAPPNAFQTKDDTGRPIIAFTIPLIAVARNIDELAFIMAHEAAHHIRGHIERQNQSALAGCAAVGWYCIRCFWRIRRRDPIGVRNWAHGSARGPIPKTSSWKQMRWAR